METTPVLKFKSRVNGLNAVVSIFRDRIEWEKPRPILATGFGPGKASTNMIPLRQVTGVTTKRDGMVNSKVTVITPGDNIEFRVDHSSAAKITSVISELIVG